MTRCFVALGSNLGDSLSTLRAAARALEALATGGVSHSAIYRSAAVGPPGQDDYLNAVVGLDTELEPLDLLDTLQALEQAAGRRRGQHWGPRTLDLDLLLYGDIGMQHPRLQIPHPHMTRRDFVLTPLADLLGREYRLPDGHTIGEHLTSCENNRLRESGLCWRDENAIGEKAPA